jgi:F-type H+-transporting ATPase subunit b
VELRLDVLITQIVGFLIVLWILKRYAWKPVLGMLEARRQRIADEIAASERLRKEAEGLKAEFENQLRTIENQARQRIQEAVAEGQKVAEEIRATAQNEARMTAERARANVELELKKARVEFRNEVVTLALGAAERLLKERLDPKEHSRIVERFLDDVEAQRIEKA